VKRTESHIKEDLSELIFRSSLPQEWIIRRKNKDYGIDFEIEIVESNSVTGNILWIQLKSSSKIGSKNDSLIFRISTNFLRYSKGSEIPIILILTDLKSKECYWLHVQDYIYVTFTKNNISLPNFEKVTIKISKQNTLSKLKETDFYKFKIISRSLLFRKMIIKILPIQQELESFWEKRLLPCFVEPYDLDYIARNELIDALKEYKLKIEDLKPFQDMFYSIGYDNPGRQNNYSMQFEIDLLVELIKEFIALCESGDTDIFGEGLYISTLMDKQRKIINVGIEYLKIVHSY
jgi:hypothetical protein